MAGASSLPHTNQPKGSTGPNTARPVITLVCKGKGVPVESADIKPIRAGESQRRRNENPVDKEFRVLGIHAAR